MKRKISLVILSMFFLTSCSFNPFSSNNHTTGNLGAAAVGAAAGGGFMALIGGGKPLIALAGVGGGMFGYYVTTLRHDAGGIIAVGGRIYRVGDYVGINIPSDPLFDPNTADFTPQAGPILDSLVAVLKRYPKHNVLISGNTSGFAEPRWERHLSQERAQRVAAYLWNSGIDNVISTGRVFATRQLNYVGYGDYFPIAHDYTNKSIRKNSHIQVTVYPGAGGVYPCTEADAGNIGSIREGSGCQAACSEGGCRGEG